MAEKNCKLCFHYDVCYAVGRMPERAETCSKYAPDVVEVKHGEWMFNRNQAQNEALYFCPFCVDGESNSGKDNYCPNCGRKMDGGADNG